MIRVPHTWRLIGFGIKQLLQGYGGAGIANILCALLPSQWFFRAMALAMIPWGYDRNWYEAARMWEELEKEPGTFEDALITLRGGKMKREEIETLRQLVLEAIELAEKNWAEGNDEALGFAFGFMQGVLKLVASRLRLWEAEEVNHEA